jgi:transglutaminase-like putative cysteine protease
MRIVAISFIFFLIPHFLISQNNSAVVLGKPNLDEVFSKTCSLDSSAEAELIYDKETIEFFVNENNIYSMKSTYHGRLKIYKKSGLDRGIIKLTQKKRDGSEELIEKIKGYTYNEENGKVVITALEASSIFKENVNNFESVTKIIAPNIKEGSVFDYTYTRVIPFTITQKPNTWFFQGNIPYRWSEVSVVIPGRFFYKLFYNGYLPFYLKETKDTTQMFGDNLVKAIKYRFVIKDAPTFVSEQYMTSYKDFIAKLEFELASYTPPNGGEELRYTETWDDINKLLLENGNFGERLNNTNFLKDIASKFEHIADTMDKVKAAFNYITKTIKWNGGSYLYINENLNKVFDKKTGTNVEINMMLVALLRRMHIIANPAIISTRDNGEVNEAFPLLNKFNYTVAHAKVGGKDIIMDATERFSKPNMLPYQSLTKKVFIIEKDHGRLVSYQSKEKKLEMQTIDYTIIPQSNEMKVKYNLTLGGYEAFEVRNYIFNSGEDEEIKFIKSSNPDWLIENVNILNKDSVYESLKISYDAVVSNINQTGDLMFFNPFFSRRYKENPFKSSSRIYPIDFVAAIDDINLITIKIPVGYKLEELPKAGVFVLPNKAGKYSYIVETENDVIKIRSQLTISKSFFEPNEYPNLRELYNLVIEKQAQQIVLRKL